MRIASALVCVCILLLIVGCGNPGGETEANSPEGVVMIDYKGDQIPERIIRSIQELPISEPEKEQMLDDMIEEYKANELRNQ